MSSPKTTSEQQIKFTPEALSALGTELLEQVGRLTPLQQESLLRYASTAVNQPGATGAPPVLPKNLFAPVQVATQQAGGQLSLPTSQAGPLYEALRGGLVPQQAAARKTATDVTKSVTSFIDPRYANILNPIPVTTSRTDTSGQTAVAVGTTAAAAAAAIAAAVI